MDNKESLWKTFAHSGKIKDYLAYCSVKEGLVFGNQERTNDDRRIGCKRNECRGER